MEEAGGPPLCSVAQRRLRDMFAALEALAALRDGDGAAAAAATLAVSAAHKVFKYHLWGTPQRVHLTACATCSPAWCGRDGIAALKALCAHTRGRAASVTTAELLLQRVELLLQ